MNIPQLPTIQNGARALVQEPSYQVPPIIRGTSLVVDLREAGGVIEAYLRHSKDILAYL